MTNPLAEYKVVCHETPDGQKVELANQSEMVVTYEWKLPKSCAILMKGDEILAIMYVPEGK